MKSFNNKYLIIILFLCCLNFTFAQRDYNWHFGHNAGFYFPGGGNPVATTGNAFQTEEGSASISDNSGNLLMYSDGQDVYDQSNQIMPNGGGLLGNQTSTQSAIFAPMPGNSSRYFLFTAAGACASGSSYLGINYSVIDMTLAGNGTALSPLGDVAGTKNISLDANGTEHLTVACHDNGTDYWLITQVTSGDVHAYLISGTTVSSTPVVSTAPSNLTGGGCDDNVGQIKVSPDGRRMAIANRRSGGNNDLLDFNSSTGVASNVRVMGTGAAYGAEFSPNSNVIYLAMFGTLRQYNATLTTTAALQGSQITIHSQAGVPAMASLQLGPNNRIYVANGYQGSATWPFIDEIRNPDVLGAGCNFVDDAIALASGTSSVMGLPGFSNCYHQGILPCDIRADFEAIQLSECAFEFRDSRNYTAGIVSGWFWTFGDGTSSTLQDPVHIYTLPGFYEVCLTIVGFNGEECCTDKYCTYVEAYQCDPCEMLDPGFTYTNNCGDPCDFNFGGWASPYFNMPVSGWHWDFGDGTTGSGQNVDHYYSASGNYNVCLTVIGVYDPEGMDCCTKTICMTVVACGSSAKQAPADNGKIEDYEVLEKEVGELKIYPNPSNGIFSIEGLQEGADLSIINMQGQTIMQFNTDSEYLNLDLSDQPSGMYFVKTANKGNIRIYKLLKE